MIKNTNKIPVKLWKSFKTDESKKVFNTVMSQSLKNQNITVHPKTAKIPPSQRKTICWNFGCYAAWATCDNNMKKGDNVATVNGKGKEVKIDKVK